MQKPFYFPSGHKCRTANGAGAPVSPFAGEKVLVVGMARSGVAAAQLLCAHGATPVLNDLKPLAAFGEKLAELDALPCEWRLGEDPVALLAHVDRVVISPGVPIDAPIVRACKARGVPLMGELELASRLAKGTIAAVTGTNGKTTTVTLLGEIFQNAGRIAHVAGNVGYPLSAAAMKSRAEDVLVTEVSSFQLETIETFHPKVAALLNVTEDHLNRHGTMAEYVRMKKRLFENQTAADTAVLNADDELCRDIGEDIAAHTRVLWFSRKSEPEQGAFVRAGKIILRMEGAERAVCDAQEVRIPGPHNLENALAAVCCAGAMGVPAPVIRHSLRTFAGVEHRIEFTRELDGVRYVNDSKGTNTDSTIKAVQSMKTPTTIILGGYDKHVSFAPLAAEIANTPLIEHVVLIGQTAPQIEDALRAVGYAAVTNAADMTDAVHKARALTGPGGCVLLSPACASFDMFDDYEQRGRVFKQIVNDLK